MRVSVQPPERSIDGLHTDYGGSAALITVTDMRRST